MMLTEHELYEYFSDVLEKHIEIYRNNWPVTAAKKERKPQSMNDLGVLLFETGKYGEGIEWINKAADLDDSLATCNLGILNEYYGNEREANRCYLTAASLGHHKAIYRLALFYYCNNNCRDEKWCKKTVLDLLTKAAGLGNIEAAENLVLWYKDKYNDKKE